MTYSVLFLSCLILLPIGLQLRGQSPATLFAYTALIYAIFGVWALVQTYLFLSEQQGHGPDDLRAYFVLDRIRIPLNQALVMAVFSGTTWMQTRFSEARFTKVTIALFWMLHLSLITSGTFLVYVLEVFRHSPRIYVDYPSLVGVLVSMSSIAPYSAAYCAVALFGLAIWAICQWLWKRSNRARS